MEKTFTVLGVEHTISALPIGVLKPVLKAVQSKFDTPFEQMVAIINAARAFAKPEVAELSDDAVVPLTDIRAAAAAILEASGLREQDPEAPSGEATAASPGA